MAELKLISTRDKQGVFYVKKYEYGTFLIRVEINPDNTYIIKAEDKCKDFEILAITNEPPVLSIMMMSLTSEMLDDFSDKILQAKELMDIIENNKDELLKKES